MWARFLGPVPRSSVQCPQLPSHKKNQSEPFRFKQWTTFQIYEHQPSRLRAELGQCSWTCSLRSPGPSPEPRTDGPCVMLVVSSGPPVRTLDSTTGCCSDLSSVGDVLKRELRDLASHLRLRPVTGCLISLPVSRRCFKLLPCASRWKCWRSHGFQSMGIR